MARFDLISSLIAFGVVAVVFGIPFFLVCRLLWRLGSKR